MLEVPVFNMKGDRTGNVQVDPEVLGGVVRPQLLKQAIVAYLDRQRQHSARTKGKADTEGSTRKLFRQKGTGNARMGQVRTPVRRGGGRTFAKRAARRVVEFPKKMRKLARDNAILAKIQSNDVCVVDDLRFETPKTKIVAAMLGTLGADRGCLLATHAADRVLYLSGRNIPKTDVKVLDDVTAFEILRRRKLVLTRPAFDRLAEGRTKTEA